MMLQLHEFISKHPHGYDAEIGERGEGLSGWFVGQQMGSVRKTESICGQIRPRHPRNRLREGNNLLT